MLVSKRNRGQDAALTDWNSANRLEVKKMKYTSNTWNTLTLLPIAIAIVFSAGLEWILKARPSIDFQKTLDRTSKSVPREEQMAGNKPEVRMHWHTVTENGRRQLRLRWRIPANSRDRREVA